MNGDNAAGFLSADTQLNCEGSGKVLSYAFYYMRVQLYNDKCIREACLLCGIFILNLLPLPYSMCCHGINSRPIRPVIYCAHIHLKAKHIDPM